VAIDAGLARQLVTSQFPRWRDLTLQPMSTTGTDSVIFRLGPALGLRFPRIAWAQQQVAKEFELLPRLAPLLRVELPLPVAVGEPEGEYPFPWLVYEWIDGNDLQREEGADHMTIADDLAAFVMSLEGIDTAGAPTGGRHLGQMRRDDATVRSCLESIRGVVDVDRAIAIWEEALGAGAPEQPMRWVHGDLLPGNVIVRGGRVAGVIDWSSAGVGDPACELMIAWSLPPPGRARFRSALDFDAATWSRARGWVVEQAAHFIAYYATTIPDGVEATFRRLRALLDEDNDGPRHHRD
jgi:aminoglycoside phosphotransferase (APT) family kinase protein